MPRYTILVFQRIFLQHSGGVVHGIRAPALFSTHDEAINLVMGTVIVAGSFAPLRSVTIYPRPPALARCDSVTR